MSEHHNHGPVPTRAAYMGGQSNTTAGSADDIESSAQFDNNSSTSNDTAAILSTYFPTRPEASEAVRRIMILRHVFGMQFAMELVNILCNLGHHASMLLVRDSNLLDTLQTTLGMPISNETIISTCRDYISHGLSLGSTNIMLGANRPNIIPKVRRQRSASRRSALSPDLQDISQSSMGSPMATATGYRCVVPGCPTRHPFLRRRGLREHLIMKHDMPKEQAEEEAISIMKGRTELAPQAQVQQDLDHIGGQFEGSQPTNPTISDRLYHVPSSSVMSNAGPGQTPLSVAWSHSSITPQSSGESSGYAPRIEISGPTVLEQFQAEPGDSIGLPRYRVSSLEPYGQPVNPGLTNHAPSSIESADHDSDMHDETRAPFWNPSYPWGQ